MGALPAAVAPTPALPRKRGRESVACTILEFRQRRGTQLRSMGNDPGEREPDRQAPASGAANSGWRIEPRALDVRAGCKHPAIRRSRNMLVELAGAATGRTADLRLVPAVATCSWSWRVLRPLTPTPLPVGEGLSFPVCGRKRACTPLLATHQQPTVHRSPSVFCPLPSAFCLLPSALCLLPSAFCLLPSAFCLLPSAFCPLPSAFCLLPSAFCPLPSALCHLSSVLCHLSSVLCPLPLTSRTPHTASM